MQEMFALVPLPLTSVGLLLQSPLKNHLSDGGLRMRQAQHLTKKLPGESQMWIRPRMVCFQSTDLS